MDYTDKDIIYEGYKPSNIVEMREYMMYLTYNSLTDLDPAHYPPLITKNSKQQPNLSQKLKRYLDRRYITYEKVMYRFSPDRVLKFDGDVEGGNLEAVELMSAFEYKIYMNVDTNTKGHQQWFDFKVSNTGKGQRVKFVIENFTKTYCLFRQGMKVFGYSKKMHEEKGIGWHPVGEEIRYYKNELYRSGWRRPGPINIDDEEDEDEDLDDINIDHGVNMQGKGIVVNMQGKGIVPNPVKGAVPQPHPGRRRRHFYTLEFEYTFSYEEDTMEFAYSRPYTYTHICFSMWKTEEYLRRLKTREDLFNKHKKWNIGQHVERPNIGTPPRRSRIHDKQIHLEPQLSIIVNDWIYERKVLCKSVAGIPTYIITITASRKQGIPYYKRKIYFITARVHPGETNSNLILDGLINFLISEEPNAKLLRNNYIFKIIPCLNPDGVICGNYRSSLFGVDLNRQWKNPQKACHPIIYYTKGLISALVQAK